MIKSLPTQKRLLELFSYDPEKGELVRKTSPCNSAKIGEIAGCVNKVTGYLDARVDGPKYKAHRLIWKLVHGVDPVDLLDHENHLKTDNRISNLREVSNSLNQLNRKKYHNNTSGVVGVSWYKPTKKWMAHIQINGKRNHLGLFTEKNDAVAARKAAETKYGFHPNHGNS